jgi:FAD/FMN-containing dehydrogenase
MSTANTASKYAKRADATLVNRIREIVGPRGTLEGEDVRGRSVEWGGDAPCLARAIIRPADTAQLAAVMRACYAQGQRMVVHGGRTGLVGGAYAGPGDLVLSLERMSQIRDIDAVNRTITVEAGATVQAVQDAARQAQQYFALDLGSRGSATIGGAIATNAGGLNVVRFGMMREQVLGLEVVLPDGDILDSRHSLLKNNTGYDLKQMFVGAEGTLGVVTQAVLRLRFAPQGALTCLFATASLEAATRIMHRLESEMLGAVCAFEAMWPQFYEAVTAAKFTTHAPLRNGLPLYVLVEVLSRGHDADFDYFTGVLDRLATEGEIVDAVIANSQRERASLWELRESIDTIMTTHATINFDIGLRVQDVEPFLDVTLARVKEAAPDALILPFGHLGDNNLHLAISTKEPGRAASVKDIVYAGVAEFSGSISAEHGIGREKKPYLKASRSASEIALMRKIKGALDPKHLLNPDLIF